MSKLTRSIASFAVTVAGAALLAATLQAGTTTVGGVTLSYPDYPINGPAFVSCEPWQAAEVSTITLTNLPAGSTVTIQFTFSGPYSGPLTFATPITITNPTNPQIVAVPYPATSVWPVWDAATNTKAIAAAYGLQVQSGGTTIKTSSKKWWIKCGSVPPAPLEGCTLGFYKNNAANRDADMWPAGYTPESSYNTAFGVTAHFSTNPTLLDALNANGGQERALARQATAALLNAAGLNFDYTVAEVIDIVQEAYAANTNAAYTSAAAALSFANEGSGRGENCPLNNSIN